MDANLITALAGVMGSLTGAAAALATTWITQRNQTVRDRAKVEMRKREFLYSEFVNEVARLSAHALDHSLERPDTLANLFALLARIRFVSTQPVLDAAEECVRHVVDLYNAPNITGARPTCRDDLQDLSGYHESVQRGVPSGASAVFSLTEPYDQGPTVGDLFLGVV